MSIPISTTDPTKGSRRPHTVVITVTYDMPVAADTLQIWRDTLAMYQHQSCSVNFGTTLRDPAKNNPSRPTACPHHSHEDPS